jgi:hypothetical protein
MDVCVALHRLECLSLSLSLYIYIYIYISLSLIYALIVHRAD